MEIGGIAIFFEKKTGFVLFDMAHGIGAVVILQRQNDTNHFKYHLIP